MTATETLGSTRQDRCLGCEQNWPLRLDGVHQSKAGDVMRCKRISARAVSPATEAHGQQALPGRKMGAAKTSETVGVGLGNGIAALVIGAKENERL
jgi:hypothetical protein